MVFKQIFTFAKLSFRGCVWYLVGIVSNRAIATLKTRKELGRVDYRKDFWDCY